MKMTGREHMLRLMNLKKKSVRTGGAVIVKFWVQIDKDTQLLARFKERGEYTGKTLENYR